MVRRLRVVTFRLHRGAVDGKDVWFIRTDSSDKVYADQERLVWAPKLATLLDGSLAGDAYLVSGGPDDQPMVLSTEPGADYTPAWRLHRAAWKQQPSRLGSVALLQAARRAGRLQVTRTTSCSTRPWSSGRRAPCRSTPSAPTTSARDSCWRHPTPAR